MPEMNRKTVSLVLGSGGARGLAHIGVIRWLEENDFTISSIAGCSIGALVGGIHAAGKLDEFEQWVRAITRVDIVALMDISWEKSGLVKGDKIINVLIDLVGDRLIEDLTIAYTAVATDVKGHREIWIKTGHLFDAIRSSISIPLLFTPFRYKGLDLIDGGVLNPVPIAPAFGYDTDMTIAVDLNGPADNSKRLKDISSEPAPHSSTLHEKINRYINNLRLSAPVISGRDWGMFDIAMQAIEAMQSTITRQKLAAYPPNVLIEIARNSCSTLEFDKASEMIELGYRKTKERMMRI